ncbi:MAG: hypothetical protein AUF63_02100 [Candidatus Rokubacteria bacterium 13_1_20CM_70_15]|nr:MAG: hypothetical protein AUF63_02100 [Candidatus Rokubacteria bacterium 13_1_20CM_70_15]
MSRTKDTHRRIEAEIVQEKAAALGRAGERLEAALLIQREAIGLRRHRAVEATYPEPPRRS